MIKEESSHMKSNLVKTNNNVAGMKYPRKRNTTSIGVKNGFANYESISDSIDDLHFYFKKYIVSKNLSRVEAAKYLEKNYAMSTGYANRLLKLI